MARRGERPDKTHPCIELANQLADYRLRIEVCRHQLQMVLMMDVIDPELEKKLHEIYDYLDVPVIGPDNRKDKEYRTPVAQIMATSEFREELLSVWGV